MGRCIDGLKPFIQGRARQHDELWSFVDSSELVLGVRCPTHAQRLRRCHVRVVVALVPYRDISHRLANRDALARQTDQTGQLLAPQIFPEHRAAQTQRLRRLLVGEAMALLPIGECFIHAFNMRDATADKVYEVDSKYNWRKNNCNNLTTSFRLMPAFAPEDFPTVAQRPNEELSWIRYPIARNCSTLRTKVAPQ